MVKKKTGRGGAREGAGRKPTNPEGRTMLVAVTVPVDLVERLDRFAKTQAWNRSQAVTEAVRRLIDA
jgi:hypothetical protein